MLRLLPWALLVVFGDSARQHLPRNLLAAKKEAEQAAEKATKAALEEQKWREEALEEARNTAEDATAAVKEVGLVQEKEEKAAEQGDDKKAKEAAEKVTGRNISIAQEGFTYFEKADLPTDAKPKDAKAKIMTRGAMAKGAGEVSIRGEPPSLGDFVALGELAWTVIKDGRPVNNVKSTFASVLNDKYPSFSDYTPCHRESSNWFHVYNIYDSLITSIDYIVIKARMHRCSGARIRGRPEMAGYLQNAWVELDTWVAWGFNLQGSAMKMDPYNSYSSDGFSPCASIELTYSFSMTGPFDSFSKTKVFRFTCDGSAYMV